MKTKQEIFNIVVTHLLTQGDRSYNTNGGTCAYRGENGRKCAVGVLIPDEAYDPKIEGMGMGHLLGEVPHIVGYVPRKTLVQILLASGVDADDQRMVRFLKDLQDTHDCFFPDVWADELRDLAQKWDVTMPEVTIP